jgi:DNA repair exonuclease SbcCD nuclease subunit
LQILREGEDKLKFIHIADIHIGARPDAAFPWGAKREKEILASFNKIIDLCNEEQVDLLLIAGDLFHRQPLIRELKEVNYCFEKLNRTQVVFIAGNHDYIGARSNYTGFPWSLNVHMLDAEAMDSIYLEDINTEIYGFSYHTRDITEARYDKVYPGCEERINILLAHGGDEKNIPIDKKAVQSHGFDYVALGHIHKPEMFSDRMAYAGSLEPLDKNETGARGYIIGEIKKPEDDSSISIAFVPNSSRRYFKLELPVCPDITNGEVLDMAKEKIKENGAENIYSFAITGLRDTDIIFHKEDIMTLGNIIEAEDETVPDYDFESLYHENEDNIIGLYIKRIREEAGQDMIAQKALYYGIEALLGAKN